MKVRINQLVDLDDSLATAIDMVADEFIQIEIQRDISSPRIGEPLYKLYIHEKGCTRVRIGRIKVSQIDINDLIGDAEDSTTL